MGKGIAAVAAVAGLCLAIVAAGCGGGEATSASLGKAAFVAKAKEICEEGQDKHDRLLSVAAKRYEERGETPTTQEETVVELQGPYLETTERLADLTGPKALEKKLEALVKAREALSAKVKKNALSIFKFHYNVGVERAASAAGLPECII